MLHNAARMALQKVHRINRPLVPGEVVLAPVVKGVVVLWPPHNDVHDGQVERHYHPDPRFSENYSLHTRFEKARHTWLPCVVLRQFEFRHSQRTNALGLLEYDGATPVDMIHGAIRALPERCVRQGRCPHKGFNLNQVPVVHGVHICPLHGMRFCARTGKGVPYRNTKDITEEWLLQNDAKL